LGIQLHRRDEAQLVVVQLDVSIGNPAAGAG
jgi:hypothetical protein